MQLIHKIQAGEEEIPVYTMSNREANARTLAGFMLEHQRKFKRPPSITEMGKHFGVVRSTMKARVDSAVALGFVIEDGPPQASRRHSVRLP